MKQRIALWQRARTKANQIQKPVVVITVTAGISIAAFLLYMFIANFGIHKEAQAATCLSSYSLNWANPSTYTVTCGTVNSSQWTVKKDTCYFFSPVINVGGTAGGPNKVVDISVRINQSGNLTNNDFAWVYYYVNGSLVSTVTCRGDTSAAVFTVTSTINVPAGGTFQIRIKLKNDRSVEFWQIKNGDITVCIHDITPLPLKLASFTAKKINNAITIKWTTVAETNNAYFTLLRSDDGQKFYEVVKINGTGTSSQLHNYSFNDTKEPSASIVYYNLKQTDFNGQSESFNTIAVTTKENQSSKGAIRVTPNPFRDYFIVQFESVEKDEIEIQIISATGTKVFFEKMQAEEGTNFYRFNTPADFKPGAYFLRITNGKSIFGNAALFCNS